MKATIKYRDKYTNNIRQKTIVVSENEPNSIIREFCKVTRLDKYTNITTVKCGRYEYQWFMQASEAGVK